MGCIVGLQTSPWVSETKNPCYSQSYKMLWATRNQANSQCGSQGRVHCKNLLPWISMTGHQLSLLVFLFKMPARVQDLFNIYRHNIQHIRKPGYKWDNCVCIKVCLPVRLQMHWSRTPLAHQNSNLLISFQTVTKSGVNLFILILQDLLLFKHSIIFPENVSQSLCCKWNTIFS